jgi:hypothetical protein
MDATRYAWRFRCPNHKVLAAKEVTPNHVDGKKVMLLCPHGCPLGCPLGEWDSEESYMAEFWHLGRRLKSLYFVVPPKR